MRATMLLPLALMALLPALAQAAGALSKADFLDALNGAMSDLRMRNQTQTGETLALEEVPGISQAGTWRVVVTNACALQGYDNSLSNNYGKAMTFRTPAVFSNQGNGFVFLVGSQAVNDLQRPAVETKLLERLAALNGEYGDLKGAINRKEDGSYQMQSQYAYANDIGKGVVRDRLAALMQQARFMLCDVFDAKEAADFAASRALQGGKLGTLSKAQFITLYPAFKNPAFEKKGDAPGGQWVIVNSDDYKIWIENMGDHMKLWVYGKLADPENEAKGEAILAQLRALEPYGGADSMVAGSFSNEIWAGVRYNYEGRTGKDIEKALARFIRKDSEDFFAKVRKIYRSGL